MYCSKFRWGNGNAHYPVILARRVAAAATLVLYDQLQQVGFTVLQERQLQHPNLARRIVFGQRVQLVQSQFCQTALGLLQQFC